MKKLFEFLFMLAGLYSGITLIFNCYMELIKNFIAGSAIAMLFWLCSAGVSTYLTLKLLGK